MSVEKTLEELRVWYNGYKFEEDAPSVYNPVSLMKCFMNEKFSIYIFEFKLHGSAEDAMKQIHDKQYAALYRDDPRKKILIGVEFGEKTRSLGEWLVEEA